MTTRILFPEPVDLPAGFCRLDAAARAQALPARLSQRRYDLSVVIPVYNVEDYVERCILSVDANQTASIQIIIVNDGSRDRSLDVTLGCAQRGLCHDVMVVEQANLGLSAARNLGLSLATGQYVAYLDSDDFMAAGAYDEMVRQARIHDADIVLCRSRILDDQTLATDSFYDSETWDDAMQGAKVRVTDAAEAPTLIALEPNANTRITRRTLIDQAELTYPEGLQFEDFAVHAVGLLAARRIVLVNQCFYYYLINRAGKITDGRTSSRFDVLEVGRQTIARAQALGIAPEQGRSIVLGLLRLVNWCGSLTPLAERPRFYRMACELFATMPSAWIRQSWKHTPKPKRDRRLLRAFRHGHWRYLTNLSYGRKTLPASLLFRLARRIPVS